MNESGAVQKVNLEEVGRYLESRGYKVQKLEQLWRHVTGEVLYENEKLFFKLSSTKEIGTNTNNERSFDEKANSVWKKILRTFKTPKVFDDGDFQEKYWFTREYVFGKPLAEISKENQNISEKDLFRAGEIAQNVMEISDACLQPRDMEMMKGVWEEKIYESSKKWSDGVKTNTKRLLQFIKENRKNIGIASCHGDFTPWVIMKTKKNDYYVIDSEASRIAGLKHYDAAYFYHRVYTKIKRPDLANQFIDHYKAICDWTPINEKEFLPVLASRIMGGYFDAERDGVTSRELNKEMEENLLKD